MPQEEQKKATPATSSKFQDALKYQAAVEKIKAKRGVIAKLPVEKQMNVYSVAFDRYFRPRLPEGLTETEQNIARDKWIVGIVAPEKITAFPIFGTPPENSKLTTASAALVGALAGAEGALKNTVAFLDRVQRHTLLARRPDDDPIVRKLSAENDPWVKALGDAEAKDYALAHGISPKAAAGGAAVGHAIPSFEAFEAGAGLIPSAFKSTPIAYRILSRAAKAAVGGAAGAVPYDGQATGKDLVRQGAINTAIDMVFGGVGASGKAGYSKIVNTISKRGSPVQKEAVAVVDDLMSTIAKEKFPGKTLDLLKPDEFDTLVKEAKLRRSEAEIKVKEAAKAVKEAKAPVKLSRDEQVLKKAQDIEAKRAEKKAANERDKKLYAELAKYKKRTGSLPSPMSDHFKQLASGKTTDDILGKVEETAVAKADSVAKASVTETLREGAPQAVEAVQIVQSIQQAEKMAHPTERWTTDPGAMPGEPSEFLDMTHDGEHHTASIAIEDNGRATVRNEAGDVLGKVGAFESIDHAKAAVDKMTQLKSANPVKEKIASAKTKSQPMFAASLESLKKATTPEEFAAAKKQAMEDINSEAIKKAKSATTDAEKHKIHSEAVAARERIRSAPVPENISKKALDAKRKVTEVKEGQEELQRKMEEKSHDPEGDLIAVIDRAKELEKEYKDLKLEHVYAKVTQIWSKKGGTDPATLNHMLEQALEALKAGKK